MIQKMVHETVLELLSQGTGAVRSRRSRIMIFDIVYLYRISDQISHLGARIMYDISISSKKGEENTHAPARQLIKPASPALSSAFIH